MFSLFLGGFGGNTNMEWNIGRESRWQMEKNERVSERESWKTYAIYLLLTLDLETGVVGRALSLSALLSVIWLKT